MRKLSFVVLILIKFTFLHAQPPEENRFQKVVLTENLNEPLELAVLPDESVLFIERHGALKLFDPTTKKTSIIANIPVSTKYSDNSEAEDGLLGLNIDPNFTKNHWVYLYYSPAGSTPENVLARFEMKGHALNLNSKKIILHIPVQRDNCCHTGGSIDWMHRETCISQQAITPVRVHQKDILPLTNGQEEVRLMPRNRLVTRLI